MPRYFCVILLAISNLAWNSGASAASVYHLVCRGGSVGNTRIKIAAFANSGVSNANVFYMFERYLGSTFSPDGSHLSPGQCSWSTGRLGAGQDYFLHQVQNSNIMTIVDFTPIDDNGKQTESFSQSFIVPDRNDPNQNYLPSYTPRAVTSSVVGSIFDPNMIFHIYVKILSDGSLQFSYLRNAISLN